MASARENQEFREHLMPRWLLDDAVAWIIDNMCPEDVFPREDLVAWAETNGFEETPK
jgi:hypothetical protein